MGILDFLKKSKAETANLQVDLPPIPKIEGLEGFPELKQDSLPPLPESSLPPLPSELPGNLPPLPTENKFSMPEMITPLMKEDMVKKTEPKLQKLPDFPTPSQLPELTAAKFQPTQFPDVPSPDMVPDTIPPLEGVPEPPKYREEKTPKEIIAESAPVTLPEHTLRPAPKQRDANGPRFIKTDDFRQVLEQIEDIKSKFKEEDDILFRITEIKNAQDSKFEDFRQSLEDMQRKLLFVDRSLFER
ncbi:hypothetical protein HQ545_05560 [Candidatus Woesearchaeota archaeon]|nr:hypothetical protein [Candidatus Woesearchaeota archaeon]